MHKLTLELTKRNIQDIAVNLKDTYLKLEEHFKTSLELNERMDLVLDMFNVVNSLKQIEKDLEEITTQLQIKNEEEKVNDN